MSREELAKFAEREKRNLPQPLHATARGATARTLLQGPTPSSP
jgi:hypothetical protein